MTSKFLTSAAARSKQSASGSSSGPQPWKPKGYMRKAVKFLLEHAAAALFLDPGLGKTSITLAAISMLFKMNMCQGWIVVAPRRPARMTWTREVRKWSDFNHLDMCLLHGDAKAEDAKTRHQIYVVTYDGLRWLISSGVLKDWLRKGWVDGIVFDELTMMANHDSRRYKDWQKWLHRFDRAWGLTGSPGARGLLKLFGQCFTLDRGKALGRFYTHYRAQFFQPHGDFGFEPAPGAKALIFERLKPLALRMAAEDYLELPKRNIVPVYYDIPDELYSKYVEFEEEYFTIIDKETIRAPNAGVASGKLRQFCSGAIYRQVIDPLTGAPKQRTAQDFITLHEAKLEAFDELMGELNGQQVLVGYEFKHTIARAAAYRGQKLIDMPYIAGGVSDKRGEQLQDMWNAERLDELWVHPASAAHGLNLQEGNAYNLVILDLFWDYELFDQLVRRLLRQGNTASMVNVYAFLGRIKGKSTIDHRVLAKLTQRECDQEELFAAIKDRRQKDVDFDTAMNERLFESNMLRIKAKQSAARRKAKAAGV